MKYRKLLVESLERREVLTTTLIESPSVASMPADSSAALTPQATQQSSLSKLSQRSVDKDFYFPNQGLNRHYIVHTPPGYVQGEILPVVLVFHGGGSSAAAVSMYRSAGNVVSTVSGAVAPIHAAATSKTLLRSSLDGIEPGRRASAASQTASSAQSASTMTALVTIMWPTSRDVAPATQATQRSGEILIVSSENAIRRLLNSTQFSPGRCCLAMTPWRKSS